MTEPVRARYATAAQRLTDLPLEQASLGCGNPVAVADLRPGETVLDLGSGAGLDVLTSARRVGPTGLAIGLDMTEDMLAVARRHAAEQQVTNAEFLPGTIEDIPLPDNAVDVVISNCVITLSADKPRVFAEIAAFCARAAESGSATSWPISVSPTPNARPVRTGSSA